MREFQHRVQGPLLLFNLDYTRITPLTHFNPYLSEMRLQIPYVAVSLFKNTEACITKNQEMSGQLALISSMSPSLVAVVETQKGTATAQSHPGAPDGDHMICPSYGPSTCFLSLVFDFCMQRVLT